MTGTQANVYIFGATLQQRLLLAAMVRDLLTGLRLLSDDARVHVKKSTHLYLFDDRALSGEAGDDEPEEIAFKPRHLVEKLQSIQAEEQAAAVVSALDRLFTRSQPDLPPFLWPRLEPKFSRSAPGRLAAGGKPHHWFVGYELLMQPPQGEVNGIFGAVMEFRLLPLKNGEWRLLLLHIRFPLLARSISTPLWKLDRKAPGPIDPDGGKPGGTLRRTVPLLAAIAPLTLPAASAPPPPPAARQAAKAVAAMPPLRYVLPVEGSNLLAPYYALAGAEGERFAPATAESALILIDEQRPGGLVRLTAAVAPATDAHWVFAWHYAGIEARRPNQPAQGVATGPVLVLPEGLYDIDLLVTKTVHVGPAEAGGEATIVLRARRMISSDHAILPVPAERAETIAHSHGGHGEQGAEDPHPPGGEPAAPHHHDV